jgi:lysophospholipase L1-like esterase
VLKRFATISSWATLAIAVSGALALVILWMHRSDPSASSQVNAAAIEAQSTEIQPTEILPPQGSRLQLTYDRWVEILRQEAQVIAEKRPERLVILAGDSLSLWFPQELLPSGVTWLNQGISGETSYGLLRRVRLLDSTQPRIVFILIGINDLIRNVGEETLVANQREIVRHLKRAHPRTQIVIQSILPHGGRQLLQRYDFGDRSPPWADRLIATPNSYIQSLNQRLAALAREERVAYLDLYPTFADTNGDLAIALSTDGLHLSEQGYRVWQTELQKKIDRLSR